MYNCRINNVLWKHIILDTVLIFMVLISIQKVIIFQNMPELYFLMQEAIGEIWIRETIVDYRVSCLHISKKNAVNSVSFDKNGFGKTPIR